MASEIQGLFGSPTSPQQIRNAYLDSMMVSPEKMGNQALLQQVVSMGQNAGAMMGEGAGRLFGGKVSGEVEAGYIDEAIKQASQVQGSSADKMRAVAEFLADKPGMGAHYMRALQEAGKLENDTSKKDTKEERMLQHIGKVRKQIAQGQEPDSYDLNLAKDYIEILGKQSSYTDAQGRVITIPKVVTQPLYPAGAGRKEEPTKEDNMFTTVGGTRVYNTPEFQEATRKNKELAQKEKASMQQGIKRINEILKESDWLTRGAGGAVARIVPGSEAASQAVSLKEVTSKLVIETIGAMKAQSKTGATGFGALNEKELENIANAIAALDPINDKRFDEKLKEQLARWQAAIKKIDEPTEGAPKATGANDADAALINKYLQKGK